MNPIPAIKTHDWLSQFDLDFQAFLNKHAPELYPFLLAYRDVSVMWSAAQTSQFVLELAPIIEDFVVQYFALSGAVKAAEALNQVHAPIFRFKRLCVQKAIKRPKSQLEHAQPYPVLHAWLMEHIASKTVDAELSVAQCFLKWRDQSNDEAQSSLSRLSDWCLYAVHDALAQAYIEDWVSFRRPKRLDPAMLVKTQGVSDSLGQVQGTQIRPRSGFALTDVGMSRRDIQAEADYCLYCHKNQGDFCRSGFPVKKSEPDLGLKKDAFGQVPTGCPLDEKISEMQALVSKGYVIAPLIVIMIDNPLCAMTGHRICNDCMKACIYQKQMPVDIPQIETAVLKTVLNLPFGVEIYDLLVNWNPLREHDYVLAPDNGRRVLVMGMGPAGFTLANQLLMGGYTVVGLDGLKIEPVPASAYNGLVENFSSMTQSLDGRQVLGFGGVAEYGITARWDKNYLSLILMVLLRRCAFRVFGGVRFGGTVCVETAWALGFDHLSVAVGAGLPRALSIPGSLCPGVRQANDFLMALQLSGVHHAESFSGLEIQLPAVIVGGGLTGIDTATEVQAYYVLQIERINRRYHQLCERWGATQIRADLDVQQCEILDRYLLHAAAYMQARQSQDFNVVSLLHEWGGVTVVYRKRMQDSPAYQRNHEELIKALEEGVLYAQCWSPTAILEDQHGRCCALSVTHTRLMEDGTWGLSDQVASFPARSILIATGAQPNVAYGFEHDGVFDRERYRYVPYMLESGTLKPAPEAQHCKADTVGMFTSYTHQGRYVSFLGDAHLTYHGSVVKAMASAMRVYPLIHEALSQGDVPERSSSDVQAFLDQCTARFHVTVASIQQLTATHRRLTICAPQVVAASLPGHFVRLQTFERIAKAVSGYTLHSEGVALPILSMNRDVGTLDVVLSNRSVSERVLAHIKPGDPVSLMGPTGVRAKIPTQPQSIVLMVEVDLIPNACVLGRALRDAGHTVFMGVSAPHPASIYLHDELHLAADSIVWSIASGGSLGVQMRAQDQCVQSDLWPAMLSYLALPLHAKALQSLTDVRILGSVDFIELSKSMLLALSELTGVAVTRCDAAVYGPMQCMLKGVCAQCLQWQIDPLTGARTKAVYACSWQDQPMARIDLDHLRARHQRHGVLEAINQSFLDLLGV